MTFAEFRDRRKICDIEALQPASSFKAEVIPGLEPKPRFEAPRPARAGFGGKPGRPGERRHGGGGDRGGFGKHTGFGAKSFGSRDRDAGGRDFGGRGRPAR